MIDRITTYGPPILNATDALRRNFTNSVTRSAVGQGFGAAAPGSAYASVAPGYAAAEYGMTPMAPMMQQTGIQGSLMPTSGAQTMQTVTRNVARSVSMPQRSIVSTQTINGVPVGSTVTPMPPGMPPGSIVPGDVPITAMPPGPATQTAFQRSIVSGGPIDPMSIREDRYITGMNRTAGIFNDQMKRENDALRAEVHRLRKIEAGWFPGGPDEDTRVTIINNYQSQINHNLEEISNLRLTIQQIEAENQQLRDQVLVAQSNPKYEKRIEELQRLNNKLNSDLAALRSASTSSSTNIERTYTAQLDALRNSKIDLERQLQTMQSQLASKTESVARSTLEERQKMSSLLDAERMTSQKLRDDVARLQREASRVQAVPPVRIPTPDPKTIEQLRMLTEQLGVITAERDRLNSTVLQLEARGSHSAVERVFDDTGIKERERLIEHYKAKWDDLNAENNRLKTQMATLQEDFQRMRVKAESEVGSASTSVLALRKEKELMDVLRQELEAAKEDAGYYRNESQKLREQLRKLASQVNKTEIHREVIVDKTGAFAKNIIADPGRSLNPVIRPGEAEVVSRSVYRNDVSSNRFIAPETTYPTTMTTTTYQPTLMPSTTISYPPMTTTYPTTTTLLPPTTTTFLPPAPNSFRGMTTPILPPSEGQAFSTVRYSTESRVVPVREGFNSFGSTEKRLSTEPVVITETTTTGQLPQPR